MKAIFPAMGLCLVLFIGNTPAATPNDRYEELSGEAQEYDVIEKEWIESEVKIPDLPTGDSWVAVNVDVLPSNQQLYLGRDSMSADAKDYVLRFWVLIRSSGGGYNAMYEGMRCGSQEYITYAYGQEKADPQIRLVNLPEWKVLKARKKYNFRRELFDDYLCAGSTSKSLKQIDQSIKGHYESQNPYGEHTDF